MDTVVSVAAEVYDGAGTGFGAAREPLILPEMNGFRRAIVYQYIQTTYGCDAHRWWCVSGSHCDNIQGIRRCFWSQ